MFRHIILLLLTIVIATIAVLFTGCGGGNSAPAGPVIMAIIPSREGVTVNQSYGEHWWGQSGKYSFALVAGTGTVIAGRGDPNAPVEAIKYGFSVSEYTDVNDSQFVRRITPDSAGMFNLSYPGYYKVDAGEVRELEFLTVAECDIRMERTISPAY